VYPDTNQPINEQGSDAMESLQEQIEYGDHCVHGNAIGTPSGYDILCGRCENGETIPYVIRRYRLFWSLGDSAPMDMNVKMYADESFSEQWGTFWSGIEERTHKMLDTGLPFEDWAQSAGIAMWVVADSYTEWREFRRHSWYRTRFTGNSVCETCGLMPLDESDYDIECEEK